MAPRNTLARDLLLAAVALAGGLVLLGLRVYLTERAAAHPQAYFLPGLVVVCVGLALRRVAPLLGLGLSVVAFAVDVALGGSLGTMLVFIQVLFEVCVHGPPWLWRWALRVSVGLTVVSTVVAVFVAGPGAGAIVAVFAALVLILPVVSAITVWQYRDQAAAERVRAEQTARLAELDRWQAVTAERTRMARELHDVIANHLSAAAIHATAALSVHKRDPDAVAQALKVIRENSVQGLAEMRQMIELLREGAGDDEPTRVRLAELDQLIAQARGAGLTVRLETSGEPRPLPVGVDLAAYRIVQESLTNALKHGTGRADVAVTYGSGVVSLTVENPINGKSAVPGAGAGLIGMRERTALLHGRFDAGVEGTRWRVHAELPT
jgi:signal transduction histidine kinase